jgi:hypothetical protein
MEETARVSFEASPEEISATETAVVDNVIPFLPKRQGSSNADPFGNGFWTAFSEFYDSGYKCMVRVDGLGRRIPILDTEVVKELPQ